MEDINVHIVFQALTRPAMILGVTVDYFMLLLITVLILFMQSKQPATLLLWVPLHVIGWVICKVDPFIFNVLLKKLDFIVVPNKKIWGCKTYAPF